MSFHCVYIQVLNPEQCSLAIYIHPAIPGKLVFLHFSCIITPPFSVSPSFSFYTLNPLHLFHLYPHPHPQLRSDTSHRPPPTVNFWRLYYFSEFQFFFFSNTNTPNKGGLCGWVCAPEASLFVSLVNSRCM